MSLIATSSRCFNALEAALEAVKTGNADSSEVMIKSIRQDGVLLQKQASILCDEFKQDEKKQQELDEDLTRQINKLHAEEVELKNRRQGLEAKKRDASGRYENAKAEKREAERNWRKQKNGVGCLVTARFWSFENLFKTMRKRLVMHAEKWSVMTEK